MSLERFKMKSLKDKIAEGAVKSEEKPKKKAAKKPAKKAKK